MKIYSIYTENSEIQQQTFSIWWSFITIPQFRFGKQRVFHPVGLLPAKTPITYLGQFYFATYLQIKLSFLCSFIVKHFGGMILISHFIYYFRKKFLIYIPKLTSVGLLKFSEINGAEFIALNLTSFDLIGDVNDVLNDGYNIISTVLTNILERISQCKINLLVET